ncbi:hypothetical protein EJ08DRAFT_696495 [Tothia fuscella]|uniref:Uncharacterized protein n=1 Tax=Tothia fuscella TaxID=1048955 RepID=A0A9P4TZY5_9PEZI|nr:hypothetical protein EJ08DRAFT_696495 [Tothia fuscella]
MAPMADRDPSHSEDKPPYDQGQQSASTTTDVIVEVLIPISSSNMGSRGPIPTGSVPPPEAISSLAAQGYIATSIDQFGNTIVYRGGNPVVTVTPSSQSSGSFDTSSQKPTGIADHTIDGYSSSSDTTSPSQNSPTFPPLGTTQPQREGHHGPPPAILALGILVPALLILSALGFFFCFRRKRRDQKVREARIDGAMAGAHNKNTLPSVEMEHRGPHVMPPPAAVAASQTSSTNSPSSPTNPPVILTTTMNNTYYTGIDTSDHISLTDQRSQASAESINGEEPPPPYRPRSVPPISRETSLRQAVLGRNSSIRSNRYDPVSGAGLIRRSEEARSPFDDPESSDDDGVSHISTMRSYPRHGSDRLSVVSDLSDDEQPQATTHSAV